MRKIKNNRFAHFFILGGILILLGVYDGGCTKPVKSYTHPPKGFAEVQEICVHIRKRDAKQFEVEQGKIILRLKGQGKHPMKNHQTSLPDGFYKCGYASSRNRSCAVGATRRLDGSPCTFRRNNQ